MIRKLEEIKREELKKVKKTMESKKGVKKDKLFFKMYKFFKTFFSKCISNLFKMYIYFIRFKLLYFIF